MEEETEAALMRAGAQINALQANERRLIDELAALRKDAERWRYWRNHWPALCRMEVARFAGLNLRTTYVQSPADMDRVTDAAIAVAADGPAATLESK